MNPAQSVSQVAGDGSALLNDVHFGVELVARRGSSDDNVEEEEEEKTTTVEAWEWAVFKDNVRSLSTAKADDDDLMHAARGAAFNLGAPPKL